MHAKSQLTGFLPEAIMTYQHNPGASCLNTRCLRSALVQMANELLHIIEAPRLGSSF